MSNQETSNEIYNFIFSRLLRFRLNNMLSNSEQKKLEKYKTDYPHSYNKAERNVEQLFISRFDENIISGEQSEDVARKLKDYILHDDVVKKDFSRRTLAKIFHIEDEALFIMPVEGDSMIGDGINEGDLVIYKKFQNTPENGIIIIASILNQNIIKRLKYDDENIYLLSSNKKYPPFKVSNEINFKIIGEVIGKISLFIR